MMVARASALPTQVLGRNKPHWPQRTSGLNSLQLALNPKLSATGAGAGIAGAAASTGAAQQALLGSRPVSIIQSSAKASKSATIQVQRL